MVVFNQNRPIASINQLPCNDSSYTGTSQSGVINDEDGSEWYQFWANSPGCYWCRLHEKHAVL